MSSISNEKKKLSINALHSTSGSEGQYFECYKQKTKKIPEGLLLKKKFILQIKFPSWVPSNIRIEIEEEFFDGCDPKNLELSCEDVTSESENVQLESFLNSTSDTSEGSDSDESSGLDNINSRPALDLFHGDGPLRIPYELYEESFGCSSEGEEEDEDELPQDEIARMRMALRGLGGSVEIENDPQMHNRSEQNPHSRDSGSGILKR